MAEPDQATGFLSRWSRRKALVREGVALPEASTVDVAMPSEAPVAVLAPAMPPAEPVAADADRQAQPPTAEPPPTLADVAALTRDSDYTRFVARGVEPEVKNAALKKLFTDPHFNVMDGLDTYIDDYGKPDPIPESMLRQMMQAQALGLFDDEAEQNLDPPPSPEAPPDEDTDLRLQPHAAPGRLGLAPGPGQDGGCER